VSGSNRVERLYDRLTARERAVLVLRSWKDGKDEDPAWRYSMPSDQTAEFNRLIELMNGVNVHLAPFVFATVPEVDKLGLRLGWMAAFALWAHQRYELEEMLLGPKGIRLEGVQLDKKAKARVRKALAMAPAKPMVYVSEEFQELVQQEGPKESRIDPAVDANKEALHEGLQEVWASLHAADLVIAEVAPEFDGEDPARPELRHILDHGLERLREFKEQVELYVGPFELPEPAEELLAKMRRLVRGDEHQGCDAVRLP
jgi:hypothetical protein